VPPPPTDAGPGKGESEGDEKKIAEADLPAVVRRSLDALVPGGKVKEIETSKHEGKPVYEVTYAKPDGLDVEVVVDDGGNAMQWEIRVAEGQVPTALLEVSEKTVHGTFHSAEEIRDAKKEIVGYVVERRVGEKVLEVRLTPDGKVLGVESDDE
jgi:hypothetical protein